MDSIPEIFVDAFGEISLKHGMIRIELVSQSGAEPRVTQRIITSLQAFSQMLPAQNGMREQLEKAGVLRPAQPVQPPAEVEPAAERGVVAAVRRLTRVEPVPPPAATATAPDEVISRPAVEFAPPRSPNFD
jgi:hypothetical protein